ncbi:MAG: DeoR/GlpR transcriptional regulator [Verrucomicrobia bacterium]|nr:MAG: DeoR/GlpR transcriptional regulator [Verrucomicrobiota bacterium]
MLAIERQRQILNLLQPSGALRTTDVASLLGVTDETVRKDFEILEKRGQLVRTHGGVSHVERSREELPFTERQAIRREEKQAIARVAASRIQAHETLFLDASSTVLTLTEYLPDLPLTILTNALQIFTALAGRPKIELICTGGLFEARSHSFIGLTAEKSLQRYHIDRMFFSGNGIDLQRGISERNSRQAAFKERVVAIAEDVVFLADHSKFGQKAAFYFANLDEISCVVTDAAADPDFVYQLENRGIEVMAPKRD